MRIKINIQIFAIIAILILTKQIEVYALLMLFALIHELAHTFVGMLLKLKPETLEIQPFGIGIVFKSLKNSEKNNIMIAVAGPVVNIIIAIIFSYINIKNSSIIVNVNILLAICNLIPIYPLDGGRILKSIIRMIYTTKEADNIVYKISNVLMIVITMISSILILIHKNIGLFIIVIYLWVLVIKENNQYILKKKIDRIVDNEKNI